MPDGAGQPAPELAIQLEDECFGLWPVPVTGSRIEMTDFAEIEQFAAPAFGHVRGSFQAGEVVVGTGDQQTAERQSTVGQRSPTLAAQGCSAWVTLRPLGIKIRRRDQQRALDRPTVSGSPVRNHQHAGAVSDQNHRPVDLRQCVLNRFDPLAAIEFVGFQRRHTAHLAQSGVQQRLPMFGNVLAQTRDDQNGCDSLQFVHFNTFAFSMTRLALFARGFL